MARHHQPTRRVNPKPSLIPKPLEDGKARCPGCSRVVAVSPKGRLYRHNAPSGETCAVRIVVVPNPVELDEAPPVSIRPPSKRTSHRQRAERSRPTGSLIDEDATLAPITGYCHDCDKKVLPMRRLCSACARARDEARKGR